MSQVKFKTKYKDKPVEIQAGWDRQLSYYHLTIFDLEDDDAVVYSDTEDPNQNCFDWDTIKPLQDKLTELGIDTPSGFWERVVLRFGNYIAFHDGNRWRCAPDGINWTE
jgi:hypothetical protein